MDPLRIRTYFFYYYYYYYLIFLFFFFLRQIAWRGEKCARNCFDPLTAAAEKLLPFTVVASGDGIGHATQ